MTILTHGPLRPCPENPRYFAGRSGKAIYLAGSHVWQSGKDLAQSDPPTPFDYGAYLDLLELHGHNFMRMWTWELARFSYDGADAFSTPHPWKRTGPGRAADGKERFDLERFNDAFFTRLRARVEAAHARGIYVSIMFFEGHSLHASLAPWCRSGHPFWRDNNVNGIDGDPRDTGRLLDLHTLADPDITALQEAYVRRVVETVNDLDNVLYEIANETGAYSTAWQYHFIDFVHEVERAMAQQHPVGMTFQQAECDKGVNQALWDGPADWISPNPEGGYKDDPPAADGTKVVLSDTDHLWGLGCTSSWVWRSFTRGLNPLLMDPVAPFPGIDEHPNWGPLNRSDNPLWVLARKQLGDTRRYALRVDLNRLVPRGDLASTGYCLADPGHTYLVYLPDGADVTLDFGDASGAFNLEWFDTGHHEVVAADAVEAAGPCRFASPCTKESVLFVWR